MKQTCIFLLLIAFSSVAVAQNRMLDKYAGIDGVSSVYISQAMFDLISEDDDLDLSVDLELGRIIHKIECLQLISTERRDLVKKISREVTFYKSDGYIELMRFKDDDEQTYVYQKKLGGGRSEFVLYVTEEERNGRTEELAIISITGTLSARDLRRAIDD